MSAALFHLLHRAQDDKTLPMFDTIPSLDVLYQQAWESAYVFRFTPSRAAPTPKCATNRNHSTATESIPSLAHHSGMAQVLATVDPFESPSENIFAAEVTEKGWPRTASQVPLFAVAALALQHTRISKTEEVPATTEKPTSANVSLSKNQVQLVNESNFQNHRLHTNSADGHSAAAVGCLQPVCTPYYREVVYATRWEAAATVFAIERYQLVAVPVASPSAAEVEAALPSQYYETALQLGTHLNVLSDVEAAECEVLLPAVLSHSQRCHACVLGTICRVISTAGGDPPSPSYATNLLLKQLPSVLPHSFYHTAITLVGVSRAIRQEQWRRVQLSHPACSSSRCDSQMSEQGQSSFLSERTPCSDWPHDTSLMHRSDSQSQLVMLASPPMIGDANASKCGVTVPSALLVSSSTVLWRGQYLSRFFEPSLYNPSVIRGWECWTASCKEGLSRALIVNSMDDIVQYCGCSRNAFYAAVAYLDHFVALATDPVASCRHYLVSVQRAAGCKVDPMAEVKPQVMCSFFTQVIAVCAMLGCKNIDTYPPRLCKMMLCLQPETRMTPSQFTLLELHVLQTLEFALQPVTVNELVDTLLRMGGGDDLEQEEEEEYYVKLLKQRSDTETYLYPQVEERLLAHRQARSQEAALSILATGNSTASLRSGKETDVDLHSAGGDDERQNRGESRHPKEWQRLCSFARFICDLMIRGRNVPAPLSPQPDRPSSNKPKAVQCPVLEIHPTITALAIIAVTAEVFKISLPQPLFALLPPEYQTHLRDAGLLPTQPPPRLLSGDGVTDSILWSFPVRGADNMYAILVEYCRLTRVHHSNTHSTNAESISGLRTAMGIVKECYRDCRQNPCDTILRRRYHEMFTFEEADEGSSWAANHRGHAVAAA